MLFIFLCHAKVFLCSHIPIFYCTWILSHSQKAFSYTHFPSSIYSVSGFTFRFLIHLKFILADSLWYGSLPIFRWLLRYHKPVFKNIFSPSDLNETFYQILNFRTYLTVFLDTCFIPLVDLSIPSSNTTILIIEDLKYHLKKLFILS